MFRRLLLVAALLAPLPAGAHFGIILPDSPFVAKDQRAVSVILGFVHPFQQFGIELVKPEALSVTANGRTTDLLGDIVYEPLFDESAFRVDVPVTRPGAHIVSMSPMPYWEPAEDVFIVHHTKTYLAAFGDETGWDQPLGLPVEIQPLTRPFGLWEGMLIEAQVLKDGQPLPGAVVEVEHWNTGGITAPDDLMITLEVSADENGVFRFVPPAAGWWGFAALTESDETLPVEGVEKAVEEGGVLWIHAEPWK